MAGGIVILLPPDGKMHAVAMVPLERHASGPFGSDTLVQMQRLADGVEAAFLRPDRIGTSEYEYTTGPQCEMKQVDQLCLCFLAQIDQDVATR